MDNLSDLLLKLSQNILKTEETNQLKLIKQLLMQTIDSNYFSNDNMEKVLTFSTLHNSLSNYYKSELKQEIKDTFLFSAQFKDKFVQTYKLLLDLALLKDVQDYWAEILAMTNDEQNILSSFVHQITNRQEFINTNYQHQQKSDKFQKNAEVLYMKQEQILILKEQYEQLEKKYAELQQNYVTLKTKFELINTQLNNTKQEKFCLLEDLGLHINTTYEQISQKYRKEVGEFTKEIQRFVKQIQQKNHAITEKQNYIRDMNDFNASKIEKLIIQNVQKTQIQNHKIQKLQNQMQKLKEKQQQDSFQMQNLKQHLLQYKKSIQQKDKQLKQQQLFVDKFYKMKKLHLQFRKHVMTQSSS